MIRRTHVLLLVLLCALVTACRTTEPVGGDDGEPTIDRIELRRLGCYGFCPVYHVVVHASGEATYQGVQHVDRMGRHRATIPDVANLFAVAEAIDWRSYPDELPLTVVDGPTFMLTVAFDGTEKSIFSGSQPPEELDRFSRLVDAYADRAAWAPVAPGDSL